MPARSPAVFTSFLSVKLCRAGSTFLHQALIEQLAKIKEQVEQNAQDIVRLQKELLRVQREGKDVSKLRTRLAQFHALHMQVLAVQTELRKALGDINRS